MIPTVLRDSFREHSPLPASDPTRWAVLPKPSPPPPRTPIKVGRTLCPCGASAFLAGPQEVLVCTSCALSEASANLTSALLRRGPMSWLDALLIAMEREISWFPVQFEGYP